MATLPTLVFFCWLNCRIRDDRRNCTWGCFNVLSSFSPPRAIDQEYRESVRRTGRCDNGRGWRSRALRREIMVQLDDGAEGQLCLVGDDRADTCPVISGGRKVFIRRMLWVCAHGRMHEQGVTTLYSTKDWMKHAPSHPLF